MQACSRCIWHPEYSHGRYSSIILLGVWIKTKNVRCFSQKKQSLAAPNSLVLFPTDSTLWAQGYGWSAFATRTHFLIEQLRNMAYYSNCCTIWPHSLLSSFAIRFIVTLWENIMGSKKDLAKDRSNCENLNPLKLDYLLFHSARNCGAILASFHFIGVTSLDYAKGGLKRSTGASVISM